jgi:hypothetical protein
MGVKCPQCHNEATIVGKVYNQVDYVNPPVYFRPSAQPFYAIFFNNIQMENSFNACTFCGLIWSKIDTQRLQSLINNKGAF